MVSTMVLYMYHSQWLQMQAFSESFMDALKVLRFWWRRQTGKDVGKVLWVAHAY